MRFKKNFGANRYGWRKWLAWYPVLVGDNYVWLEVVLRRAELTRHGTDYWYYEILSKP